MRALQSTSCSPSEFHPLFRVDPRCQSERVTVVSRATASPTRAENLHTHARARTFVSMCTGARVLARAPYLPMCQRQIHVRSPAIFARKEKHAAFSLVIRYVAGARKKKDNFLRLRSSAFLRCGRNFFDLLIHLLSTFFLLLCVMYAKIRL